jgi:hypothetical protein
MEATVERATEELNSTVEAATTSFENSVNETTSELSSRVDNIIAHNNDTEGNTELLDIRTGFDGTVYDNAGQAVREQTRIKVDKDGEKQVIPRNTTFFDTIEKISVCSEENFKRYDANSGTFSIVYNEDGCEISHGSFDFIPAFNFPTVPGHKYKLSFDISTGTSKYFKIQGSDKTVLTEKSDVSGANEFEFEASSASTVILFTIKYNVPTFILKKVYCYDMSAPETLKDLYLPTIPIEKLPDIPIEKLPTSSLKIISPGVNVINGVGDFELFIDGFVDTDMRDDEYSLYSTWRNIISDSGMIGKIKMCTTGTTTGIQKPEIKLFRKNIQLESKKLTVKMKNLPSNPSNIKNVLFIGDSLVAGNYMSYYFKQTLNDLGITNINLLGRVTDSNHSDNKYEAVGGYAWNNYVDDPSTLPTKYPNNYFWNPTTNALDISYYFDTYCGEAIPDYIIANIGWNHIVNSNYSSDLTVIETKAKTFINAVHSEYPNCKIILNGMHYGSPKYPYPTCNYRKFAKSLGELYYQISTESDYSGFVTFCDIAPYFDYESGMKTATRLKNKWSTETETYITDFVHPSENGYKMHSFADALCFMSILE